MNQTVAKQGNAKCSETGEIAIPADRLVDIYS